MKVVDFLFGSFIFRYMYVVYDGEIFLVIYLSAVFADCFGVSYSFIRRKTL